SPVSPGRSSTTARTTRGCNRSRRSGTRPTSSAIRCRSRRHKPSDWRPVVSAHRDRRPPRTRSAEQHERHDIIMTVKGAKRVKGVITVHKYEPVAYHEPIDGPKLAKIHVEESFSGDIEGDGVVEFLQAARADGSATFVGIERVTGSIHGRKGTFLLQDSGTVEGNIVKGEWFV